MKAGDEVAMFAKRLFVMTILCCTAASRWAWAAEPDVVLNPLGKSTTVFAGKLTEMSVTARSHITSKAILSWSLVVADAVVARGEKAVELEAGRTTDIRWPVEYPDVKPGAIASAKLVLGLKLPEDVEQPEATRSVIELSICSPDAAALRQNWLKSLDVVLFDPSGRTAAIFERAKIPFRPSQESCVSAKSTALIVYGERIDAERLEVVWNDAIQAATAGHRVLILSSVGLAIPQQSAMRPSKEGVRRIVLQGNETIHQLDQRLNVADWPTTEKLATASAHWAVFGQQPVMELRDDDAGWSYVDLHFHRRGRLIWVGWNLIDAWDATPSARYTLLKLFEQLSTDQPVVTGETHDDSSTPD